MKGEITAIILLDRLIICSLFIEQTTVFNGLCFLWNCVEGIKSDNQSNFMLYPDEIAFELLMN